NTARGFMSRPIAFVLFFCVALAFVGGVHYYFWARLVRDTALRAPWRSLATWALVVLAASLPVALILGRALGPAVGRAIAWPACVWRGMMVLLLVPVAGAAVVRLAARVLAGGPLADPERRLLFRRVLGAAASTVAAGLGVFATRSALGRVALREVAVELP